MGDALWGEFQEDDNKEENEELFRDIFASLKITYNKKDMTDDENCEINVTLGNGQKMNCKLKVSVNMKMQGG